MPEELTDNAWTPAARAAALATREGHRKGFTSAQHRQAADEHEKAAAHYRRIGRHRQADAHSDAAKAHRIAAASGGESGKPSPGRSHKARLASKRAESRDGGKGKRPIVLNSAHDQIIANLKKNGQLSPQLVNEEISLYTNPHMAMNKAGWRRCEPNLLDSLPFYEHPDFDNVVAVHNRDHFGRHSLELVSTEDSE